MAATGWFVTAGEVRTNAGERQMRAGNYPASSGRVDTTEKPDIPIIPFLGFRRYVGELRNNEDKDATFSLSEVTRSMIDQDPKGEIPGDGNTDVWLFGTLDGGQVYIRNSDLVLTSGPETAAYLSLYGGNSEDDGTPSNVETWWGNIDTDSDEEKVISRYQHLSNSLPVKASSINRLRDAAMADLAWLENYGYTVSVDISIRDRDSISLAVQVNDQTFEF